MSGECCCRARGACLCIGEGQRARSTRGRGASDQLVVVVLGGQKSVYGSWAEGGWQLFSVGSCSCHEPLVACDEE